MIQYSKSSDSIFCAPCFLFCDSHVNGEFVSSPFQDWTNATGIFCGALYHHSLSFSRQQCNQQAVALIAVIEKKVPSIKSQLVKAYDQQMENKPKHFFQLLMQFKAGYRSEGHCWNRDTKQETGILNMFDLLASYCSDLKDHISSSARNARYLSPKIQNDLSRVI